MGGEAEYQVWDSLARKTWKISTHLWVGTAFPPLSSLLICLFFVFFCFALWHPRANIFSIIIHFCAFSGYLLCLFIGGTLFLLCQHFVSLLTSGLLPYPLLYMYVYLQIIIICWGHLSRKRDTWDDFFVLQLCANLRTFYFMSDILFFKVKYHISCPLLNIAYGEFYLSLPI